MWPYRLLGGQEEVIVEGEILIKLHDGRAEWGARALLQWGSVCKTELIPPAFLQLAVALRTDPAQECYLEDRDLGEELEAQKVHHLPPHLFSAYLFFPIYKVEGKKISPMSSS